MCKVLHAITQNFTHLQTIYAKVFKGKALSTDNESYC